MDLEDVEERLLQVMNGGKNRLRYVITLKDYNLLYILYKLVVHTSQYFISLFRNHGGWRKLRYGAPDNLTELEVTFENIAVDGSSSCIPGEQLREGEDGAEGDGGHASPVIIGSLKRNNSTISTAPSPKKKSKSPMVKVMKGIWDTMQSTCSVAQKAMQGDYTSESIKQVMRLVVECGAKQQKEQMSISWQLNCS